MARELTYQLTNPNYTIYHRAALGGLAATIRAWGNNKPAYFAHVIESKNVDLLQLFNIAGQAAFPDKMDVIKK